MKLHTTFFLELHRSQDYQSIKEWRTQVKYGIVGSLVYKGGIQNYVYIDYKYINILKKKYCILYIDVEWSFQKVVI